MDKPVFDSAAFISIDLNTGLISTPGQDKLALVSNDILALVPQSDELSRAANLWGEKHGTALSQRTDVQSAGIEVLSTHLGGTLAALGMGRIYLEIRHDALVFRIIGGYSKEATDAKIAILLGFITGYLTVVSGHPFAALDLGEKDGDRLVWVGNPDAVKQVRRSMSKGRPPLAAIDDLEMGGSVSC
jgi:hypothetical protein